MSTLSTIPGIAFRPAPSTLAVTEITLAEEFASGRMPISFRATIRALEYAVNEAGIYARHVRENPDSPGLHALLSGALAKADVLSKLLLRA